MFPLLRNKFNANSTIFSITKRWATNLGGGSTTNGRDSAGKRLGIKMGNGSRCKTGQIIVRQRGFQYYPGQNVGVGRDHTFWAKCDGIVQFSRNFWDKKTLVNVVGKEVPKFGPIIKEFHVSAVNN